MKLFTRLDANVLDLDDLVRPIQEHRVSHVVRDQHSDMDVFYRDLAQGLGRLILAEEDAQSDKIVENAWHNIRYIPGKEENAYKHSNHAQPLHTDYCAYGLDIQMTFFFCEQSPRRGGATVFVENEVVLEMLDELNPRLKKQLLGRTVKFRSDHPAVPGRESPIVVEGSEIPKVFWNPYRIDRTDEEIDKMVSNFEMFLSDFVWDGGVCQGVRLKPGEGLFFHDMTLLHGRHSFVGDRWLKKGAIIL